MGVTVERPQVVMTADDGMRLVLENAARLERRSEGEVALRTETGEQRPLATERKLKVEVPNGRQFRLVLDDGSEVWLNAGSKLEYPATFENASERCVRIEGEAFFEIKRDTCRPFCVELGDGECIRVLGTSFNVNAYAGNGRHVTTLVTGRIGYAASAGAEEVVLEPNQQVSRDLAAGTVAVSAVDASVYGAWKEGWLWFENESLPALAERLGRIYGIRVEVAARLGEYTFSGKIRQDRGVEYILNLLSETSDVICKVENGVMRSADRGRSLNGNLNNERIVVYEILPINSAEPVAGENPDAAGAAAVHRAAENFVGPAGVGRAGKRVAGRGAEEGERGLRVRILL